MKKSVKVRVICLITAALVLGGAVTVAAVLGSPYETLKNALLDVLFSRNATEEGFLTVTVNGIVEQDSKFHTIQGDDSSLTYYFNNDGDVTGYRYSSNGLMVGPYGAVSSDGLIWSSQWYRAHATPQYDNYYERTGQFAMFGPDERGSSQTRFFELLADALVGDLKNNITMTSENGIRYIRGTLTGSQMPELVKAGVDMLIEQSSYYRNIREDVSFDGKEYVYRTIELSRGEKIISNWKVSVRSMTAEEKEDWENGTFYSRTTDLFWGVTHIDDNPYIMQSAETRIDEYTVPATPDDYSYVYSTLDIPMQSLVIDYVHGEAEVDMDGNLLYISVTGTATAVDIFGAVKAIEVKAASRFYDIGTSNPACPIPGAELLLTPDYMNSHFGNPYIGVYFTLSDDGSINPESVTTTYPGELDFYGDTLAYGRGEIISEEVTMLPVPAVTVVVAASDVEE